MTASRFVTMSLAPSSVHATRGMCFNQTTERVKVGRRKGDDFPCM